MFFWQGQASVLQRKSDDEEPIEVGRLGVSDYFGELQITKHSNDSPHLGRKCNSTIQEKTAQNNNQKRKLDKQKQMIPTL